MLLLAFENFVFFSTLLALPGFLVAWSGRAVARRARWQPHPATLTRLYASAVLLPPALNAWLVAVTLLPKFWLGETAFRAAHPLPHHLHLLGDLTAAVEPLLAYLTLSFAVALVMLVALSSLRVYWRVNQVIKQLTVSAVPPAREQLALVEPETVARQVTATGRVIPAANTSSRFWLRSWSR